MPKVYLPEMTFAEVEDIIAQVELAVIPTGSNEGHG
ncbi:MAG: creatininase family protein, partial [Candidatus Latescibacteria bacterium]|nr:creatininase family protein [Candidatus Latescibacterota bacterium]